MHMADSLLSPEIGLGFCALSAGAIAISARSVARETNDDHQLSIPMMGVMGSFVFAAQMINFTIPGTGSSGHLGGGMLLSILFGGPAAILIITSVLIVQALFFGDGGLLALGTNIFNLGIIPAAIGLPLYRLFSGRSTGGIRNRAAVILASVFALEFGAAAVTGQTVLSGRSALPLDKFGTLMLGIHLPIGVIEGAVTAGVLSFVARLNPVTENPSLYFREPSTSIIRPLAVFLITGFIIGGLVSQAASDNPDGLEWALEKAGFDEAEAAPAIDRLDKLQASTAVLHDYQLADSISGDRRGDSSFEWGKTVSGIVGGAATLGMLLCFGLFVRLFRRRPAFNTPT